MEFLYIQFVLIKVSVDLQIEMEL